MAVLFGTAIAAFCLSTATGSYNNACIHAVDAGSRQVGIRQQAENAEDRSIDLVNYNAMKTFGREAVSAVAAGGYIYRVTKEKFISFRLPTLGMCDSINNQITPDSYRLILEWKW